MIVLLQRARKGKPPAMGNTTLIMPNSSETTLKTTATAETSSEAAPSTASEDLIWQRVQEVLPVARFKSTIAKNSLLW